MTELPARGAGAVARFVTENWEFHRSWEPYREPAYFTRRQARRRLRYARTSPNDFAFWIYHRPTPDRPGTQSSRGGVPVIGVPPPIGAITVSSVVRGPLQSCFLGYKMDQHYLRRGFMREALLPVLTFAFDDLGLHRIEANVMPRNRASLSLLHGLGFYEEGVARQYLRIQGRWEDHIHMVKLAKPAE